MDLGQALALNPNIQPCGACQSIVNYAAILGAEDIDAYIDALVQVFDDLAPVDAPFSPEMAASIAAAFEEYANDENYPNYALAMEYMDALVGYITVLENELGTPVGDSAVFVLDKYGSALQELENTNIEAFISMRLENLGG